MCSLTLRKILRDFYGVDVGAYSYGSLCDPGMADPNTSIGRYVSVGPGVRRFGAAHPLDDVSLHPFWYNPDLGLVAPDHDVPRGHCRIESEVWIGANALIMPGCTRIGFGAVVGAGSVVTREVDDFTIVAGSPARVIGKRLTAEVRAALLKERPWELEPADLLSLHIHGERARRASEEEPPKDSKVRHER